MTETDEEIGELERGQQVLREKIAESDRLIEATDQRLAESRAFAARQMAADSAS